MNFEKIDPGLLLIWRTFQRGESLERHTARWGVYPDGSDGPFVHVSLNVDVDHKLDDLDPRISIASSETGRLRRSASVPLDCIEKLSEHPAINRMFLSVRRRH